jgi:hypothetical protein
MFLDKKKTSSNTYYVNFCQLLYFNLYMVAGFLLFHKKPGRRHFVHNYYQTHERCAYENVQNKKLFAAR